MAPGSPAGSPPPSPAGSSPGVLRIGNASGFYGDRFDALREMLTGGPLDVLTGDYLAELTMLILGRDRLKNPDAGYAKTFLRQLEEGLGLAHERGVRIVTNAGGLNPAGLAAAVRALAERVGVPVRVAHVEGDDLLGRGGWGDGVLTANAYLGGAGIAACLRAGADVVVTGRVTDAALVTGPAAAHFGWDLTGPDRPDSPNDPDRPGDLDALAGAVVAGHVLECGTQATGGNYSFFTRHDIRRPGFPLAEIHADGSAVITKHDGTGGVVDIGTVTAQLLYETGGARYAGPDVTARLDTVRLDQVGPDRVRISGVRGEPPPPALKVGLNRLGGLRNEIVFVLTGLDIDAKARLVRGQVEDALAGRRPAEVRWELARTDRPDADTEETASALLRLVVRDSDPDVVGRAVSGAAVELALGSYPGFHVTAPPGKGVPYGVFEAAYVDASEVAHTAVLPDGRRVAVPTPLRTAALEPVPAPPPPEPLPAGLPTRRVPLGLVVGARSGDKGGDANVGVWARSEDGWRWLAHELTTDRFRELIPESRELTVIRHLLPRLRAVNFTVEGLLGEGVAAQARFDPQAKALGEWLRARHADIPEVLL
ncbi:acyclic terpene utilization AtuA family protein [Streptomyces scopuliridis]|uniref:acyclic terpene utilization AtuA family protein n=1 Tax=Streptomyces scopuliridis TaxID=452529 RepID=UPI0006904D7D|nr:acyclic terpene utilization AtuA family protein [Streptomyces scopuliridis]